MHASNLITERPVVPTLRRGRMSMPNRRKLRDEEILRYWNEDGLTLEAIGEKFDLTRERVRQIVEGAGGKSAKQARIERKRQAVLEAEENAQEFLASTHSLIDVLYELGRTREETLLALSAMNPEVEVDTIEDALRLTKLRFAQAPVTPSFSENLIRAAVYFVVAQIHGFEADRDTTLRLVPREMMADLMGHTETEGFPSISTDTILRAIAGTIEQLNAGLELSLAHEAYEEIRAGIWSEEGWSGAKNRYWPPTKQTVMKRLGDSYWDDAMQVMGFVVSPRRGRPRGHLKYTEFDYEAAMRDFLAHCAASSEKDTFQNFEDWLVAEKQRGRTRPSGVSVRNKFGGWISAVQRFS